MTTKLKECRTRNEAYEMLQCLKVNELKVIAKDCRAYVNGKNKKEMIERIIDCTVGAKLRSEAIKGIELKR